MRDSSTANAPASPGLKRPRASLVILLLSLATVLGLIAQAISQRRDDYWAEVAQAQTLLDRGNPDQALRVLKAIREEKPGSAEGLTLAARSLLLKGAISTAKRTLERSLSINPDQAEASKMLAAIYLASGDGVRGEILLKKAAELDPGDYRPWYALGKVYHDLGRLDESAASYQEALKRSPPAEEARESRLGRIRVLLDARQPEQAGVELDALRQQAPDDPALLALAARQAYGSGQAGPALELAGKALALDPSNFDALLTRARARFMARRPREALDDLEKALRARPQDVGTLQLMAQVQKSLGQEAESAETQARAERSRNRILLMDRLAREISKAPNDPYPRFLMGQAAAEGEMYMLAYECFQAALDLDPQYQPAREAMDALRTQKGFDYRKAVSAQGEPTNRALPGTR
jgi:predicted Zn-dependent protease